MAQPLLITEHRKQHTEPPTHHVLASSQSSWLPTSSIQLTDAENGDNAPIAFRNPWPSWHKPTLAEVWQGLEWGEDRDTSIDYAMQDVKLESEASTIQQAQYSDDPTHKSDADPPTGTPTTTRVPAAQSSRAERCRQAAAQLLQVEQPDFSFHPKSSSSSSLKATWLGHAGVLLQLAPLSPGSEPTRVLFDPIFSQRCSPSQLAGPIRSYQAPCPISALPPVDLVIISHNHYDHLDYETVRLLWENNADRLRFVVPLGNKAWFTGGDTSAPAPASTLGLLQMAPDSIVSSNLAIPDDRVIELDWWDEISLTQTASGAAPQTDASQAPSSEADHLRIICTPAQHGSGRYGVDANRALWSSWFLKHTTASRTRHIFFGGDTGCQFHGPAFPPAPPIDALFDDTSTDLADEDGHSDASRADDVRLNIATTTAPDDGETSPLSNGDAQADPFVYPACPAFDEIVERLGRPHFLMLPVSVGATISFLRSYVPLPDSLSPFPRISTGLTAANHMPPWDAVSVFASMTDRSPEAVCMAIHWGTFISGPEEVLKTLGQLKWACNQQRVRYARSLDRHASSTDTTKPIFVALNHGASIEP
ncbi:Metallo-hydrolase/oxidoreductase [Testicularia cyperi]|uniref:Metallo-hydrolase/oxidoreductase n=1 Tax=Testicularia cyperi TaxID=1882483 RepID=A0A317XMR7_9BASI|nr:Metallo-hydrolase/oxidoreductase [Testicularia cyperi]